MKLAILVILVSGLSEAKVDWTQESRQRESEQASMWQEKIEKSADYKPNKRLQFLRLGLRNMGYRHGMEGHSSEIDGVYRSLQKIFLSTPGHAEYFADFLETQRSELKLGNSRGSYDLQRLHIIRETLVHLPSPETVKVLGGYLYDERDNPSERTPTQDSTPIRGSGNLAAEALGNIGLRNPPMKPWREGYYLEDKKALEIYREWYDKVKSGEMPFSFVGQRLEYRFQPDGSVASTQVEIPEEELKQIEDSTREPREPSGRSSGEPGEAQRPVSPARPFPWLWIAAAVVLLGGFIGFVKMRKC